MRTKPDGVSIRAKVAFAPARGRRSAPVDKITDIRLEQLSPEQAQFVLVFLLIVGLIYCFLGYSILRFVLALTGFVVAGAVAAILGGWFSQGNLLIMGAALLFGGLCGAMALSFLYRAGVFLVGFGAALILGLTFFFGHDASYGPVMTVACGLFGGVMALLLERPVMKLATAAIGGWLTSVSGLLLLLNVGLLDGVAQPKDSPQTTWMLLGAWAFLTLFGGAFQFSMGRWRKGRG